MTTPGTSPPSALPAPSATPRHLPGLDGLRAIAVSAVVVYHAAPTAFPGGFLGVDLFFVLSGFLISELLAAEFERTGRIDFGEFYLRRARRLLPALFALLFVLAALVPWLLPDAAAALRDDALAALVYASNWWFVWNGTSYFDTLGRPPLLQHLWSLAIEEQFYLCWPFLMAWALRRGGRGCVASLSLMLAILSTCWMAWLALRADLPASGDPSRLYFGTDTHAMGLFIGAAFAMAWQPWRPTEASAREDRLGWDVLGVLSLGLLACAFLFVEERDPLMFRGGYLAIALLAGILVTSASRPHSKLVDALSLPPLRWLGERSYALYLWHWPIVTGLRPGLEVSLPPGATLVLQVGLAALCAEFSYRWVERPLRTGGHGKLVRAWRRGRTTLRWKLALRTMPRAAAVVVLSALAISGLLQRPGPPDGVQHHDVAHALGVAPGEPLPAARIEPKPAPSRQAPPASGGSGTTETPRSPTSGIEPLVDAPSPQPLPMRPMPELPPAPVSPSPQQRQNKIVATVGNLTAVGDSVLLGARHALLKSVANAETDAEVGRQAAAVLRRLQRLRESSLLSERVVLHLGTNGLVTESQLRAALEGLRDRARVVVVNAVAPRRWVTGNNRLIDRVLPDYPNAVLADWAGVAAGHPEFFVSDGIHLSASGQRAFVGEIVRALSATDARGQPPPRPSPLVESRSGAPASASTDAPGEESSRVF